MKTRVSKKGNPAVVGSPSSDGRQASRRDFLMLGLASATAMGLGLAEPASAKPRGASGTAKAPAVVDVSCRVAASRLDTLVADAFPRFNLPVILPRFDRARHGARYDVDLHRLITTVKVPETGERVKVSGLLAVPVGVAGEIPIVSWQHGTILSFDQVPSNLVLLADPSYRMSDERDSLETLFNVQRLAGQGYAVIAADYIGKGPFRKGRAEGYAVEGVTVETCIAVLDAGFAAMKSMDLKPGRLFLNGWSQGALNTQWLHQELRRRKRPIVATAVQSPFNELPETWRFWAGVQSFPLPAGQASYPATPQWISLCMIVALGSYQTYYGIDGLLESAIRPEFHGMARKFWKDYSLTFDTKPFPSGQDLLVPGLFDGFTDDRNSALVRRLGANTPTYWHYDSPIRFYYGLADEAIHPRMATRALVAGGGQTSGVPISGGSHRGTFLASLYGQAATLGGTENLVDWFDKLRIT